VDTCNCVAAPGNRLSLLREKGCGMHKKETLRRQVRVALAAGISALCGAGMMLLGPAGAVLGALLLIALLGFAGAVVFSRRDEPIQRVLELIKALWRDR